MIDPTHICDTCACFVAREQSGVDSDLDGECRLNPPTIIAGGEFEAVAFYPPVDKQDWCSNWIGEIMGEKKGSIEYMRRDGLVEGGEIVQVVELHASEPKLEVDSSGLVTLVDEGGKMTKKYVVAIAEVD